MSPTALMAALAIVGGTVHPGDGPPIEGATVVVDGGRIVAVGKGVAVPAGATVVDAAGALVTPGLIDVWTRLGLVEIWGVEESNDVDAGGDKPIRAGQRATDSFNPFSPVIPIQRAHGVTTVLTAPGGGLIAGQSAIYDLDGSVEPVRAPASVVVGLGGRNGGSRGAALAKLREALEDARLFAKDKTAFERNQLRRMAARRVDLEALVPVVRGEVPLSVVVFRRADILAVLRFAAEQKVRVVLVGALEAWMVADAIAAARVPVVIVPIDDLPFTFDTVHAREDAAARLHAAGVAVALTTDEAHNVRKLRQWAGNAVRAGLPHDAALRSVTSAAADAYGLADRGRIAVGKVANLVVWSGDPFELGTQATHVVIGGRVQPADHRQKALLERYRTLPARPRKPPAKAAGALPRGVPSAHGI